MQYENSLALRTSLETGWRIGDVLSLERSDLQGRTLRLRSSQKAGKPDKKVVSADLAKRLVQISDKKYIFVGRFGDKPRCRQTVWKDVKKAAKRLRIDGNIAPHSARKTYAVEEFHEHGLAATQKALQHDKIETTMLYAFSDLIGYYPALEQRITDDKAAVCSPQADTLTTDKPTSSDKGTAPPQYSEALDFFADKVAQRVCDMLEQKFSVRRKA